MAGRKGVGVKPDHPAELTAAREIIGYVCGYCDNVRECLLSGYIREGKIDPNLGCPFFVPNMKFWEMLEWEGWRYDHAKRAWVKVRRSLFGDPRTEVPVEG